MKSIGFSVKMAKKALIIRHVPHEGIAGYRQPIEAAGYILDRIDVLDPAFSQVDLRQPDLLIMMGGPMGVYEQTQYPWIGCQLKRLAQRLDYGAPTLGVCFGAQMMAAALGARVYAGPVKEVGFRTLTHIENGTPLEHLRNVPILHWHGDSFDRPDNVELLASSDAYDHQAFRRGKNILALQFHAEMGMDPRFDEWLRQWPEAPAEAGLSIEQMQADHAALGPQAVAAGRRMIADWIAGVEPH